MPEYALDVPRRIAVTTHAFTGDDMTSQSKPEVEPVILDAREAVAVSKLSLTTLKRRHRAGHQVGLRRNGRRLHFVRAELIAYLTAPAARPDRLAVKN